MEGWGVDPVDRGHLVDETTLTDGGPDEVERKR